MVSGGSLRQERQGKSWGQLEEGIHLGRLVHTFRFLLLAGHRGKARVNTAQEVLLAQREMVQSGMSRGLRVAVLELLQGGTAQGTGPGLRDWKGTALAPLVGTALESQDRGGNHQVPREVLGIGPVPRDPSKTGTGPEPLGQMCRLGSHPGRRAGPALLELYRAIRGLWQAPGCRQEQKDLCSLLSLPGLDCHRLRHLPAEVQKGGKKAKVTLPE